MLSKRAIRVATALACIVALCAVSQGKFAAATAPYAFSFPRDHFAHDAYRTEWWYFTGHLRARDGHRFGYELTLFRIGLEPHASAWPPGSSKWRAYQLYPAHFAISDITGGRFVHYQTFARDALGQGYASESSFDVGANGWRLRAESGVRPRMHLTATVGGDAIDLVESPQKPPAIHGSGGISRKGACGSCASHYYSFTRIATRGVVTRNGMRFPVEGTSWMDHEYGSDELQPEQSGWDWFSVQLFDGRELMLYRLRQRDGSTTPQSSGTIVDRSGKAVHVPLGSFAITANGSWKSPHTNAIYPSGWRVRVAGLETLDLAPELADQELADPGGTTYWEGSVSVRDASGKPVGTGYVELTGYASAVRL